MKLGLINSAWAQAGEGHRLRHPQTKEIGFDSIDIFADPLDIDAKERKLIRTECEKAGLPIVSVACVAVGLIDFNPSVQRFHVDRCKAYLDFCYEFEAKNLLLVLGEYIWERQVIPPAEQWATGVKHLQDARRVRRGPRPADRPGTGAVQAVAAERRANMVRFIDDVDHPAVKANIDMSHLELAGTKPEELRALKGKAIHVHISDCDGKVHGDLPPGRGVVDFVPVPEGDRGAGHRRGDQHRAGVFARAGQDRRVGDGGVHRETDKLMRKRDRHADDARIGG